MDDSERQRLIREIDESFRNRGRLYWLIYDELRREVGPERAERALSRAIERRGREMGAKLFAGLAERTPKSVADAFVAASPAGGALFPNRVHENIDGSVEIAVSRCPLKDSWIEAGLSDAEMTTICRVAGHVDRGVFAAAGLACTVETWTSGRDGCCRLRLSAA